MLFERLRSIKSKIFARHLHKHICKMNLAYLRHLSDVEKFELTFQYVDSEARVERQFNFCRQASESVNTFAQRVAANIEKVIKKKRKSETIVSVLVSVDGKLIQDEAVSCKDVFVEVNNVCLEINSQLFKVIINSPWVSAMTLPNSILAGFPVYPTRFESIYTNRNISEFTWFKSLNKREWTSVGSGYVYNANNSDVGAFLKLSCLPRLGELEGPRIETVSSAQVQASPGVCPFEARHSFTKEKCTGDIFRIISYNILADLYCNSDFTREVLHPYCPPYALDIDYRKQLFIKEIIGYNADIVCLQEVDRKIYNCDLQSIFTELGYGSDFCLKRGSVSEGTATFFRRDRFKRLETFRLVLADELSANPLFSDVWGKIRENERLSKRISGRSSVLQVNVLESLENEEILVVGNTHLYFHPDADHIRLLQGWIIIKYIEDIMDKMYKRFDKRSSLILCGDFNSVPECGIYQLYTTGSIPENHSDFESNPEEAIRISLHQSIPLKSACGTPKYTNFTAGFADCLDYIYYQSSHFEVRQVVPFPSHEELSANTALPSVVFPSDHLAVVSDLEWI